MPRLNHGTLLENLVVLEVTRSLATTAETTVEFACAFSMSPLTQCWHKTPHESTNNPRFNANVMLGLLNGTLQVGPPMSYSSLLLDCLRNTPNLPVVPFTHPVAASLYPFGGPNGALLSALLRRGLGQTIRIWSNDLVGCGARYQGATTPNAGTECPRTNWYADMISSAEHEVVGADEFCDLSFPDSIPAMRAWQRSCVVRIGFLDPDSYLVNGVPKGGQVGRAAHIDWLTSLHQNALCTAAIMFFASQNAPNRPTLIAAFHNDAVGDYPHSVVFRHGNFMVGVKLRSNGEDPIPHIITKVRDSWAAWSSLVGRPADGLSWYIDGQA